MPADNRDVDENPVTGRRAAHVAGRATAACYVSGAEVGTAVGYGEACAPPMGATSTR
jgi:hypothetical protein